MANTIDNRQGQQQGQGATSAAPSQPGVTAVPAGQASAIKDALWNATSAQPWGQSFWHALEETRVPAALSSGGALVSGADTAKIYDGMSAADQKAAKDALYNAVKDLPAGQQAWSTMWQAGLVPGAPGSSSGSSAPQQGGSATAQASGGSTSRAGGHPEASASKGQAASGGAAGSTGHDGGTRSSASPSSSTSSSAGGAGDSSSSGSSAAASGGRTATSSSSASGTTTGASSVSAVAGSGQNSGYSREQMATDLKAVLQEKGADTTLGGAAKRNFGAKDAFAKWTPQQLDQLYSGLTVAHDNFYPSMSMRDFSHMVLAEGAQESSGDPARNCDPRDTTSWNNLDEHGARGFMQVTPGSVVKYFREYGTPIKDAQGNTVADPKGDINLANPAVNVAMWGWYTKNVVALSQNIEELKWRSSGAQKVTPDFGNAQNAWLQGGHIDRHRGQGDEDYRSRSLTYFVNAGFGSEEDFKRLQSTNIGDNTVNLRK